MGYNKNWLPHLKDAIPKEAWRNQISMYTIALEGWRRGLTLTFFSVLTEGDKLRIHYSLSDQGREHHFHGSEGDKIAEEAVTICDNKVLTYKFLTKAAIPIPRGKAFDASDSDDDIVHYATSMNFPLVLKPTNGSGGRGVIANIRNSYELRDALIYVRQTLNFHEVIVEQYIQGREIRVFVLDGHVLGAVHRRPPNVVGDGKSSIRGLIDIKNEQRKAVPHLYNRPIKIDRRVRHSIRSAGYTLDSVPKKGERVFLGDISNISVGGEPVDVTDELSPELKSIAVHAAKAIPGLAHCGVDLIIDQKDDKGVVIEVNTAPGLGSHLFPIEGKARDIPKAIIDYYFPETKTLNAEKSNVYFDYKTIEESLKGGAVNEIEVLPAPSGEVLSKRFTISGTAPGFNMDRWITKHVFELDLIGEVRSRNSDAIEVIVSGKRNDVNQFAKLLRQKTKKIGALAISEEVWEKPVKAGFKIRDGTESMTSHALEVELDHLQRKVNAAQKEKQRLERQIQKIERSRSWKLTAFIRKTGDLLKKKEN